MEIGNKYLVEADEMNFTLLRYKKSDTGKITKSLIGYFAKLSELLKYLVDREVRLTKLPNLETVVAKQEELYKLIENIKDGTARVN